MVIKHIKIGDPISVIGKQIDQTKCVVAFTKELIAKGSLPLFGMFKDSVDRTLDDDNLIGVVKAIDWRHGTVTIELFESIELPDLVRAYKAYRYTMVDRVITEVTEVYGFYLDLLPQPEPIGAHT